MSEVISVLLLAVSAYLIGGIPFSLILGKLWGVDIRKEGSGNVGSANVMRTAGRIAGILAFAGDMGKGAAAVFVSFLLNPFQTDTILLVGAYASVIGHIYPVYLKGKGGKGVATGAGAMLMLSPAALASAAAVYIIGFYVSRRISSVGSLAAAVSFPLFLTLYYVLLGEAYSVFFDINYLWFLMTVLALITLIIVKHIPNIARLLRGDENRFGGDRH